MTRPLAPRAALLAAALLLAPAARVGAPGALLAQAAPARAPARATAVPAREDFDVFLDRFQSDTAFQLSRVRFPLPWFSQADDSTSRIVRQKWEHLSLRTEGETFTQLFDNFGMELRDTDERVWSLIGRGSDIRQNYFFQRLRGKWYLVRVEDLSI
ncbi:MAG TPA: DUF4348 domain-containing protein [Gemmatimonadaceae bacterium]|nr:DUF4348 domain-containing protein [Gemmatimonadaceae bacterium]